MYGIGVKFFNNNTKQWSKPFTYLYKAPINPDAKVLVPNGTWYAVGLVVSSTITPNLMPHITYKNVIMELKV